MGLVLHPLALLIFIIEAILKYLIVYVVDTS